MSSSFARCHLSLFHMWNLTCIFVFKFPAGRYDRSVSPRSGNGPRPFNFHFCRMRQVGQLKGDKFAMASLIH